jgi:uncharacterized peroxidase-related enzyme
MPHIPLSSPLPGMTGLLQSRPETAKPLRELAQVLLRNSRGLTPAEGETIATYVSVLNECEYCSLAHGATAATLAGYPGNLATDLRSGKYLEQADPKLRALLNLAQRVQASPTRVTETDVAAARAAGAGDEAIHDTVLIAAAFCMFNRYVDGLATLLPDHPQAYGAIGQRLATQGYVQPPPPPKLR